VGEGSWEDRELASRLPTSHVTLPPRAYAAAFDASGTGMAVNDLVGRFLAANRTLCDMLGYSEQELRTRTFADLTHAEHRDESVERFAQLTSGQVPDYAYEKRYVARDGSDVWARVNVALIRDDDGAPLLTTATMEDVSAERAAAEGLELTRSLLRVAGDLASVGGWAISLPDRVISWSDEIYRILEAPAALSSLDDGFGLYEPSDLERLSEAIDRCAEDGTPFDLQLRLVTFTDRPIVARLVGEAQLDERGRPHRLVGAFQDISELVGARERATVVETRLTDALESMTDAFYLLDPGWRFAYVNPRAEQLLRRSAGDLLGRTVWEAFPETVETPLHDAYHRAAEGGGPQVLESMWYPPLETWFQVNAYPSPQGVAVYFRDVTDEHQRRERLVEREATLREQAALLDESQDAIVVRDLAGEVTYWNLGAQRLYGWSAAEASGRPLAELVSVDPAAAERATRAVLTDGTWRGELRHRSRGGDEVVVEARWILLRDAHATPTSILVTDTDVTERRRIEQQLLRAQRMESIGTLAGGIAHDLNNVLAPILLAVELIALDEEDEQKLELLRTVESSAQRGAEMVRQVLSFARGVSGERVELDVRELIDDVLGIVGDAFPRDVRLEPRLHAPLAAVNGDATQLHQVLMNLLVNARDAMPNGGTVRLRATTVVLDEQYAAVTPDASAGTYVAIEVEDDGHGMRPEVVDRAFEPFFTTKAHGEGTGLGLSTSLAIVRGHGGHIRVYSEPERGTTFRVHLPVASDPGGTWVDAADASPPSDLPRGRGERVLVVDDEAAVRDITQQTLEAFGYRVDVAGDGAEAVALFARDPAGYDLVITDVTMPVMDGPATVHAVRSIRDGVPVIATSGLNANGNVGKAAAVGVEHFLGKPYTALTLLELVRRVLDEQV
jgi:two-component system, cell cycle sensor histidine kinase and response regulator CckA